MFIRLAQWFDQGDTSPVPTVSAGLGLRSGWWAFWEVAKPYWVGDKRRQAWTWMAALIVLMLADTKLAVMLNDVSGELMSSLASKNKERFWHAVVQTLWVIAMVVPTFGLYYYLRMDEDLDNPDQRICEDVNTFTGRSINFLLIFLGSVMQLVAFGAVLWSISTELMAFLAAYAVGGTAIALLVFGRPLISLNHWQLRREADLRFSLMRVRENAESIAFYRGEEQERGRVNARFEKAYDNYEKLIKKQRSLNLFQRAFSQLTLVLPVMLLANEVLSGKLEVGAAVQAAGAFAAVLTAISMVVDNFESLSRFLAGIGRLQSLWHALEGAEGADARAKGETIGHEDDAVLSMEHLTLHTPRHGRLLIDDLNLKLAPGEGLLITGASGCGKSSLLRAIAGLWQRGRGMVKHPPMNDVFFLPQRPYLQSGTLRSQMIYPSTRSNLTDEALITMLDEVCLPDLAERVGGLDAVQDWEKVLSMGEQQRLAFARVLVHGPRMAILDEATSALDSRNEAALYQRLRDAGTTLVSIAHRSGLLKFHQKVLELKDCGRWQLSQAGDFVFED